MFGVRIPDLAWGARNVGGMGLGSVKEKELWGRGRERSGLCRQWELDPWAEGEWSLTKGLPCVDVNDEARDLVSA